MSDASGPAGSYGSGARQLQLNPERAPALIAKWQKLLGKDLKSIEVEYKADGVTVNLFGLGKFVKKEGDDEVSMSIAEYKAKKAEVEKPSNDEALRAFRNKFEVRLGREFPSEGGPKSASEADIQTWLNSRPFVERRAMLMSNKQFKTAYPNGLPAQAGQ